MTSCLTANIVPAKKTKRKKTYTSKQIMKQSMNWMYNSNYFTNKRD